MAKRKWVKPPLISMREMVRNMIRTTSRTYNGKDYTTTLDSIYFSMHGENEDEVNNELAKWIDLNGVELHNQIILAERFFP